MFTSKAKRNTNSLFVSKSTPKSLGPGAYVDPNKGGVADTKFVYKGPAGFLSTSKRDEAQQKFKTPPPGYYYRDSNQKKEKLSSASFKSTTRRFIPVETAAPGPGDYNPEIPTFAPLTFHVENKPPEISPLKPNTSEYKQNLKHFTAPSIPSHFHAFGYEEGKNGELIRQKPAYNVLTGTKDDSVGPGQYQIPSTFDMSKEDFRPEGSSIFRSRTKRDELINKQAAAVPGPGHYEVVPDPLSKSPTQQEVDPFKVVPPFNTTSNRSEWYIQKNIKDTPGPGQYGFKSSFRKKIVPESMQNFGSTSERKVVEAVDEEGLRSYVPPVGQYDPISPFGKKDNSFPERFHGPFGSTTARFSKAPKKAGIDLGPGQYLDGNTDPCALNQELKKKVKIGSYGVFGSTSRRFEYNMSQNPGPGSYSFLDPDEATKIKKLDQPSSFFHEKEFYEQTKTAALQKLRNQKPVPGPGAYYSPQQWVKKPYSNIQSELLNDNRLKPESYFSNSLGKKEVFISTSPRFKTIGPKPLDIGPGQYYKEEPLVKYEAAVDDTVRPFGTSAKRFSNKPLKKDPVPGPGNYDVTDPNGLPLKKSFNANVMYQQ